MANPRQGNERLFCWEQVERANPLFRISQAFAPPGAADRLLPLYALFSAVEQLCANWSEAELAARKLDWWRAECLGADAALSAHPVLQALSASNAMPSARLLAALFDAAGHRLDGAAPSDLAGLEALCRDTALPPCMIELSVLGEEPDTAPQAAPVARIGLAQLLRESLGQGRPNRFWWLPLNLLARHGVSRAELEADIDGTGSRAVFGELLAGAADWPPGGESGQEPLPPAARHLAVQGILQHSALDRLQRQPPSGYAAALRRAGPTELFRAWRCARRVSRP